MPRNSVLLGDSGYANTDYLVTPIPHAMTAQEERFNRSQRRTRRVIECAIGVLKQRFRCLLLPQHLRPAFVGEIIRCCAALHNLLIGPDEEALFLNEEGWRPDGFLDDSDEDDDEEERDILRRQQLVNTF